MGGRAVAIHRLAGFSDEQAYQVTDFLLGALPKLAGEMLTLAGAPGGIDLDTVLGDTIWDLLGSRGRRRLAELVEEPVDDALTNVWHVWAAPAGVGRRDPG